MPLHLFDKPDPGPSLDELLEGFWGGKDPSVWRSNPNGQFVWALERTYLEEKAQDAFYYEVFHSKEAALWSYWFEALDEATGFDDYFDDITPSQWLADTLTEIQQLRDEGGFQDFDILHNLREVKVQ